MQTVSDFMTGLSMGVTVLIGQAVGARDKDRASKTFGAMVTLFLTAGVALSVVMLLALIGGQMRRLYVARVALDEKKGADFVMNHRTSAEETPKKRL